MPKQPHTYTCVPLDACVPQSYSHTTTTSSYKALARSLPIGLRKHECSWRMHVRVGSANRKNKWRGAERGEGGRKRERASIHRIACPLSIASMFPPSHCMSAVHCFNVSHSPMFRHRLRNRLQKMGVLIECLCMCVCVGRHVGTYLSRYVAGMEAGR